MWKQLIYAMLRVSLLGFGGGPSSIPLMHKEVVEKYGWMKEEEFSDILAIGNTLPGPILTKMSGYIGYRLKGVTGAAVALLVTTVPTILGMLLIFTLLGSLRGMHRVEGMTKAIQPVVGVMLAVLAYGFLRKNWSKVGMTTTLLLAAGSYLAMSLFHLHPAILITLLLIGGFSYAKPIRKKQHKKNAEGSQ